MNFCYSTGGCDQNHSQEKKCKKAKWLSEEASQIAEKRREAKGKGEKDRYFGILEFQRISRRQQRKIDAFELWCWKRLLRVPWTARRSNQSILKEISPECSLEGLMLKLKL